MAGLSAVTPAFRKSSYSNGQEECVEVAANMPYTVAIRDSKRPEGPTLRFRPAAWAAFQRGLTGGRFER